MEISTVFVSKFYQMDPEFDDLLPEGADLQDGMIVLIEDSSVRANEDTDDKNKYGLERLLEVNRWCTVSHIKITKRYQEDEYGRTIGESSPLVSFIGTYADGSKKKRMYDSSYAWLVKKDSIPAE